MRAFYLTPEQYLEVIEERDQAIKSVIELMAKYPNDMELGEKIREMFGSSK